MRLKKLAIAATVLLLLVAAAELAGMYWERTQERQHRITLPPRAPGELRVFAYGGSTTAGFPDVPLGFVAQLEFWLRRSRPGPVLVENFGIGGGSSARVRTSVSRSIHNDPDVVVLLSAHNEFLPRLGAGPEGRHRSALVRVLKRPRSRRDHRHLDLPRAITPFPRDQAVFARRLAGYFDNVRAIADLCAQRGIPLVVCTGPRNLLHWPPLYRRVGWTPPRGAAYETAVDASRALIDAGDIDGAEARIQDLLLLHRDDAMLTWLLGRVAHARGDMAQARVLLERACDLDAIPVRALGVQNQFLRELAAARGLPLVDAEQLFAAHSEGGIPGRDIIPDNCHPTARGNALIATALLEHFAERGWLGPGGALPERAGDVELFLEATFQTQATASRRYEQMLRAGHYCIKEPWLNWPAARDYFREAAALRSDGWEAQANLGTVELLLGNGDTALEHLRRATLLRGAALEMHDDRTTPYLRTAMQQAGLDPLALLPP